MDLRPEQIDDFLAALDSRGVEALEGYGARLRSNAGVLETLGDFAREGLTAATLRQGGFRVAMREAPDLDVALGAARFHVEVARFRRRREDAIDDAKLRACVQAGRLETYGNPQECSAQVFRKLRQKAARFPKDRPAVVAIYSDSPHQIEQLEVFLAMCAFNNDLRCGSSARGPFAGAICLGGGPPAGDEELRPPGDGPLRYPRVGNVGFYPAISVDPALPDEVSRALAAIARRVTLEHVLS